MALGFSRVSLSDVAKKILIINYQQFRSLSNQQFASTPIQHPIPPTLDYVESITDFSWDSFVTNFSSSSPQKAQLVLQWRLEKLVSGIEKNRDYFLELINLCGKIKNMKIAMQAFASMEGRSIKPTPAVFNALISTCLSSHDSMTAFGIFETMSFSDDYKPNSETYDTFISAYAKIGNGETMQDWYLTKKNAGFSPNLHNFEELICGSIKVKKYDDANKYYEEMMSLGIKPNIPILQSKLVSLCEMRNWSEAKEFLKSILETKWEISAFMVNKLMSLLTGLGKPEEMEEVLMTLTRSTQDLESLYQAHIAIIKFYANFDRLNDAEHAIVKMLKLGILFSCDDDIEKVICMYFRRNAYDRVELFLERIKKSHKLGRSTYDLVVAGYRRARLYQKVDSVINEMKIDGLL